MRRRIYTYFLLAAALVVPGIADNEHQDPVLTRLPGSSLVVGNTVPANGDVNPYGVAFVPPGFPHGGSASRGDILVANFNNSTNSQGTGTTIVAISPGGGAGVFFQGNAGLGLSTALGVLAKGVVLVGNVPTTDGSCATIQQGSLLVLNKSGQMITSLANASLLDGPWDLTVNESGPHSQVFVSNVLSGTVTRLDLDVSPQGNSITVVAATQIASGYGHRCDSAALVVGPTGLAYDAHKHLLYVASTDDNAIYAIPNADRTTADLGKGTLIYTDNVHLRGPLGLVLAPNGDLITTNGDAVNGDPNHPSEMIEFTPSGQFVAALSVDPGGQGGAFGIAVDGSKGNFRFAAVDDVANTLKVWTVK